MQRVQMVSIVDDDESVRNGISSLIRSFGWETSVFSSAQDFLDSGLASTVDCVITDVQMPGMTGLELQQRLIADGHKMPIIFITAYDLDGIRKQALDNGATCFLLKPIDADTIIRYLERLFDIAS
jgi:FixJ family two-component response regulator